MDPPTTHRRLAQSTLSANLGGLLVGLHLALFSGILEMPSFAATIHPDPLTPRTKSQITSALIAGAILGALPAGPLCDLRGRRPALLHTALLFALATLAMAFSTAVAPLTLARFLAGLAYAVANIVCPMYSAELAPPHLRGVVVNLYQLSITLGILLAQLLNWRYWASPNWNRPLLLAVIPAVVMLAAVYLCVPESPAWLMAKARPAEARAAAYWLAIDPPDDALPSRDEEGGDGGGARERGGGSFMEMVADPSARTRLLIGAGLGASQQCTGINAVIFFGPALVADVLRMSGSSAPFRAAAVVGFGNFAASMLSMAVIERYGRRRLLLTAGPPMVASLVVLGMMRDGVIATSGLVGVGALLTFICAFAVTYGPLPFVVSSEIFPVRYKGVAMSTCSMILSLFAFGIGACFLPLLQILGGGIYYLFASCVVASSVFIFVFVPETRNLSLKDIDALLSN